jgi:hypothetical protein
MHPFQLLSRWSRRKLDSTTTNEASDAPSLTPPAGRLRAQESSGPVSQDSHQSGATVGHESPAPDLANLVPIEEITAETDIRGFLTPGVPVELARAALRHAWHSDPAIRDFVGLADYDWDFNAPDSIVGFGKLNASTEIERELTRLIGRRAAEIIDHELASPPATNELRAAQSLPNSITQPDGPLHSPAQAESNLPDQQPEERADRALPDVRKHGGALPT